MLFWYRLLYTGFFVFALGYGWFNAEASIAYSSIPVVAVLLTTILFSVISALFFAYLRKDYRLNLYFLRLFEISVLVSIVVGVVSLGRLYFFTENIITGALFYIVIGASGIPGIVMGRMNSSKGKISQLDQKTY